MQQEKLAAEQLFTEFRLHPAHDAGSYIIDALGGRTNKKYLAGMPPGSPPAAFEPIVCEGYLEWVEVLGAAKRARGSFTFVELGTGWGRWMTFAGHAARRLGIADIRL